MNNASMTSGRHHTHLLGGRHRGFTLLEAMLAIFIFSAAAVSLVEAINATGRVSAEARRVGRIQLRLDNLLLEATRDPAWAASGRNPPTYDREFQENGILFRIHREPLEMENEARQPLPDLYAVRVTAEWQEGGETRQQSAETWVYPPLFHARRSP